jgi:surface antigen
MRVTVFAGPPPAGLASPTGNASAGVGSGSPCGRFEDSGACDQCTAYAYERRPDIYNWAVAHGAEPYNWNAYKWAHWAQVTGLPTGSAPAVGAIAVYPIGAYGSSVGHVAYVEKVNSDGSYTVSEENFGYSEYNNGEEPGYPDSPDPSLRTIAAGRNPAGTVFIYGGGGPPPPPPPPPPPQSGSTFVSLSTGSGFSAPQGWSGTPFYGSKATLVGDVNGDGKADLIAVDEGGTFVMLSTGSGFSAPQGWSGTPFYGSKATLVGDVNGDGKADLIAVDEGGTFVMLSTGSGFSAPQGWSGTPFYGSKATLVGDVNGDGKTDLIAVNEIGSFVMLSTGSSFSAVQGWSGERFFGSAATLDGDVNGDGKTDLIAVNEIGSFVMLSTGSSFSAVQGWSGERFFGSAATLDGDVNGDGKTDLVAVNYTP